MTSMQRYEVMRRLKRHPNIREHVDPTWKLKKLQPAQLLELAASLEIDLTPILGPGEFRPSVDLRTRRETAKTKNSTSAASTDRADRSAGRLSLVSDNSASARQPPLRIVTTTSDREVARRRALPEVRGALQHLVSNLLRVVRGAGRPHEIFEQNLAVLKAMEAYRTEVGVWPSADEISEILSFDARPDTFAEQSPIERERSYAERSVMKGALQAVASSLIGQRTQETAGESEMYDGINRLTDILNEERAMWAAHARASLNTIRRPKKTVRKSLNKAAEPPGEGK
jgi:hypothetical protein